MEGTWRFRRHLPEGIGDSCHAGGTGSVGIHCRQHPIEGCAAERSRPSPHRDAALGGLARHHRQPVRRPVARCSPTKVTSAARTEDGCERAARRCPVPPEPRVPIGVTISSCWRGEARVAAEGPQRAVRPEPAVSQERRRARLGADRIGRGYITVLVQATVRTTRRGRISCVLSRVPVPPRLSSSGSSRCAVSQARRSPKSAVPQIAHR